MQFCKAVDHFKTLPDNKLEKEARAIAAEFVGEGTPKAVSGRVCLINLGWYVGVPLTLGSNSKDCGISV